jgi:hypothetical protein
MIPLHHPDAFSDPRTLLAEFLTDYRFDCVAAAQRS